MYRIPWYFSWRSRRKYSKKIHATGCHQQSQLHQDTCYLQGAEQRTNSPVRRIYPSLLLWRVAVEFKAPNLPVIGSLDGSFLLPFQYSWHKLVRNLLHNRHRRGWMVRRWRRKSTFCKKKCSNWGRVHLNVKVVKSLTCPDGFEGIQHHIDE